MDRWKGGQRIKLEGSDHAPVYTSLRQIPSVPPHNTPSLSCRYIPMVYGVQQTLGIIYYRYGCFQDDTLVCFYLSNSYSFISASSGLLLDFLQHSKWTKPFALCSLNIDEKTSFQTN